MSARTYRDGVLVEEWDDATRTYTDYTTDPPTSRPYTQEENAAADQRAVEDAVITDLRRRVELLEAAVFPSPPDPADPADPNIADWSEVGGIWPPGGLLRDDGVVWRNVSGVPLTTPPSGFPGDASQWTHLFVQVFADEPDPDPEPDPPAWSPDGVVYKPGDVVTYQGKTYTCLQGHTSQAGWTPDAVPSLWKAAV